MQPAFVDFAFHFRPHFWGRLHLDPFSDLSELLADAGEDVGQRLQLLLLRVVALATATAAGDLALLNGDLNQFESIFGSSHFLLYCLLSYIILTADQGKETWTFVTFFLPPLLTTSQNPLTDSYRRPFSLVPSKSRVKFNRVNLQNMI